MAHANPYKNYIFGILRSRAFDREGLHAWLGVSAMRGRVWAAGAVQRCSKPIQTYRIVSAYNVLLLGEVSRAVCGLASQLWVPGRAGLHGRLLLSCCPIILLQLNFSLR
eukprot:1160725-Pelagomonas_calceolata.AAC.1